MPPLNAPDAATLIPGIYARNADRPNMRLASGCDGSMIGCWSEPLGRFVAIASATITGHWVQMDYEIKINGALPDYQWQEIERS